MTVQQRIYIPFDTHLGKQIIFSLNVKRKTVSESRAIVRLRVCEKPII